MRPAPCAGSTGWQPKSAHPAPVDTPQLAARKDACEGCHVADATHDGVQLIYGCSVFMQMNLCMSTPVLHGQF